MFVPKKVGDLWEKGEKLCKNVTNFRSFRHVVAWAVSSKKQLYTTYGIDFIIQVKITSILTNNFFLNKQFFFLMNNFFLNEQFFLKVNNF